MDKLPALGYQVIYKNSIFYIANSLNRQFQVLFTGFSLPTATPHAVRKSNAYPNTKSSQNP